VQKVSSSSPHSLNPLHDGLTHSLIDLFPTIYFNKCKTPFRDIMSDTHWGTR
jgi:hypothetical protein